MKSSLYRLLGASFVMLLAFTSCRNEDNKIQPTCFDEVRNQGELRVDCGGPNCPECPPTCDDRLQNQGEQSPQTVFNPQVAGIDCGGSACEPCSTCEDGIQNAHWVRDANITEEEYLSDPNIGIGANGQFYRLIMESGIDCGFPCPFVCEPTCEDGIQNGTEEGVDCGGICENPCFPPSCTDGIQNGTETGIDCGDSPEPSICGPCPPPTCNDGIQNVHIELNENLPLGYVAVIETGIDCDNNPQTSCPDCPLPTCFDGIQNGIETGVDCGGNCGTACSTVADCNNGIQDGTEAGIDCDFDISTPCPPCATCADMILNGPEFDIDCLDYPIPGFEACDICPSCHDNIQTLELFELDVDCGGPNCDKCFEELTVAGIGTGNSAFRDQYSYNLILSEAGLDTLGLDPVLYPGLKVEKVNNPFGGANYLKVTANQGFETGSNGLLIRTIELYMPWPESSVLGTGVNMINMPAPSPGLCFVGVVDNVPFFTFKEVLIDNPNLLNRCSLSFFETPSSSQLTYTYRQGFPEASEYYTKGNITPGVMRSADFTGAITNSSYGQFNFSFQYPYFP